MFNKMFFKLRNKPKLNKILSICIIFLLALYIFSVPSFSALPRLNLASYAILILLSIFVFIKYILFEKFVFSKRLLILFFFVIESFIGTAIYSHEFRRWFSIVLLFVSFVIIYFAFCCIKNKKVILQIVAFPLLAFGLYFLFRYRISILKFNLESPLGNDFDNVNTIGTYFSLGSSLFLYLALAYKRKFELLYLIPCLLMLFLGLFTGSRHYILTSGVACITAAIVSFRKRKWLVLIAIIVVVALFFIFLQLPQMSPLKERIDRAISTLFGVGNAKYDPSAVQRTIWPQYGFFIGSRSVIFGYGAEGFSIYSGIGTYSHNTYSEIVCNFGILGGLLFFFAILYPFVLTIRSKDRTIGAVIVIVFFYLSKGFFGVYYASKDAYIMLALIFCFTKEIKFSECGHFFLFKNSNFINFREVNI